LSTESFRLSITRSPLLLTGVAADDVSNTVAVVLVPVLFVLAIAVVHAVHAVVVVVHAVERCGN
jgi:hypothetical protein